MYTNEHNVFAMDKERNMIMGIDNYNSIYIPGMQAHLGMYFYKDHSRYTAIQK